MLASERILEILDRAAESFVFPMLDNGYIYPAAARLSCFRNGTGWAFVFETFGYSPRAGIPDLCVTSIGEGLVENEVAQGFATPEAFDTFRAQNAYWRQDYFHPLVMEDVIDWDHGEALLPGIDWLTLRGEKVAAPDLPLLTALEEAGRIGEPLGVANVARGVAESNLEEILATLQERRTRIPSDWDCLITLDDWRHPNVVDPESPPSASKTMQALADVVSSRDAKLYSAETPNTHWSNWPDGGTL